MAALLNISWEYFLPSSVYVYLTVQVEIWECASPSSPCRWGRASSCLWLNIHRKSTNLKSNKKTHLCQQLERNRVCPYSSVQPNENPFRTQAEHQALLKSCCSSMKSSKEGKSFVTNGVQRRSQSERWTRSAHLDAPGCVLPGEVASASASRTGPGIHCQRHSTSDPLLCSETWLGRSNVSKHMCVHICVCMCSHVLPEHPYIYAARLFSGSMNESKYCKHQVWDNFCFDQLNSFSPLCDSLGPWLPL